MFRFCLLILIVMLSGCVQEFSPLNADFDYSVNWSDATSQQFKFSAKTEDAVEYSWNFGDLEDPNVIQATGREVSHTYSTNGQHKVTLVVRKAGVTASGSVKTVTARVPQRDILILDFNSPNDQGQWIRQYNTNGNTGEELTIQNGYLRMRMTGSLHQGRSEVVYGLRHQYSIADLRNFRMVAKVGREELHSGDTRFAKIKIPVKEYNDGRGGDLGFDIFYENGVRKFRLAKSGRAAVVRTPEDACEEVIITIDNVDGSLRFFDSCTQSDWPVDEQVTLSGQVGMDVFYTCPTTTICGEDAYGAFSVDYLYIRAY